MNVVLPEPFLVFTGAGLSTASGIPDFRSKGGVWDHFDADAFTIKRFHADPAAFWDRRVRLIRAMDYLDARPNPAHDAIAQAAREDRVHAVVTQNVDGLHAKAGTPPERLIEVHGNGLRTVCLDCGTTEDVRATLRRRRSGHAPRCPACDGLLKPDVVLFGEPVPRMHDAAAALEDARGLLVAGTSLQVQPAAGLVDAALDRGLPVTLCNRDPTPYDDACALVRGPVEETLPHLLGRLSLQ